MIIVLWLFLFIFTRNQLYHYSRRTMRTKGKTVIIVLAAILIGGAIGFLAEEVIKATYRTKLERTLDDLYLEGKPSIGAILINPKSKHELYKTGNYYIGDIIAYISGETDSEPLPSTTHLTRIDGDYFYDLSQVLLKFAQDRDYSYWTTKEDFELTCLAKHGKTYEFTDIIIIASLFHQLNDNQVDIHRFKSNFFNSPQLHETSYYIDNSIYDTYLNYLAEGQFKGVHFYVDSPKSIPQKTKYSAIQSIRKKSIAKPEELYWGNKYCCFSPIESPIDGMDSHTKLGSFLVNPSSSLSPIINYAESTIQYKVVYKSDECINLLWLCLGSSLAICLLIAVMTLAITRKKVVL